MHPGPRGSCSSSACVLLLQSYAQEPSSVLPKKQFPEEGGETTSQFGMHSCRNSIVLFRRLRQKMESCPTGDNTAAYNKAKAEFTRQKLQQTRAAWYETTSSLNKKNLTSCGSLPSCYMETVRKKHRQFYSQRESLLLKRKQPAGWQSFTKKRAMSGYQVKEPVKLESS